MKSPSTLLVSGALGGGGLQESDDLALEASVRLAIAFSGTIIPEGTLATFLPHLDAATLSLWRKYGE